MSHWRQMFTDERYLGSYSLEKDGKYQPVIVTIDNIYVGEFVSNGGKEARPFAKFKEFDKPMVINRTNFKRLEKFFGSFDYKEYIGKQIVLGVEDVKSPEGIVAALRFSTRPVPVQEKQLPAISEVEFQKAKENIANGKSTVEKVLTHRSLTEDQINELKAITNA